MLFGWTRVRCMRWYTLHLADDLACGVEVTELGIEGADPDGYHAVGDVPLVIERAPTAAD